MNEDQNGVLLPIEVTAKSDALDKVSGQMDKATASTLKLAKATQDQSKAAKDSAKATEEMAKAMNQEVAQAKAAAQALKEKELAEKSAAEAEKNAAQAVKMAAQATKEAQAIAANQKSVLDEVAKANEHVTNSHKFLGLSFRELKKSAAEFIHLVPGGSAAMYLLKNATMAVIMALGMATAAFFHWISSLRKDVIEGMVKAHQDLAEAINKAAADMDGAKEKAAEFKAHLSDIAKEGKSAADELERLNQNIELEKMLTMTAIDAKRDIAIARAESDPRFINDKAGLEAEKFRINKTYETDKAAAEKKALDDKAKAEKDTIARARKEQADAIAKGDSIEKQIQKELQERGKIQKPKTPEELRKMDEEATILEDAVKGLGIKGAGYILTDDAGRADTRKKASEARKAYNDARDQVPITESVERRADARIRRLEKEKEIQDSKAEAAANFIREHTKDTPGEKDTVLGKQKSVIDQKRDAAIEVDRLKAEKAKMEQDQKDYEEAMNISKWIEEDNQRKAKERYQRARDRQRHGLPAQEDSDVDTSNVDDGFASVTDAVQKLSDVYSSKLAQLETRINDIADQQSGNLNC